MIVAGVDPGLGGGVAVLQDGCAPVVMPMPIIRGPKRDHYDLAGLRQALCHCEYVFIEKLSAMPGFGTTGNFAFGRASAVVEGVCAGAQIPYELVLPRVWQRALLEPGQRRTTKQRSLLAAGRLYPGLSLTPAGCRKPSHGLADALLIATHGRRLLQGAGLRSAT